MPFHDTRWRACWCFIHTIWISGEDVSEYFRVVGVCLRVEEGVSEGEYFSVVGVNLRDE